MTVDGEANGVWAGLQTSAATSTTTSASSSTTPAATTTAAAAAPARRGGWGIGSNGGTIGNGWRAGIRCRSSAATATAASSTTASGRPAQGEAMHPRLGRRRLRRLLPVSLYR